jgi:hypothetical protein
MANTITAGNATNNGMAFVSDSTGELTILTGTGSGTTALSINSSQVSTFAGATSVAGNLSFNSGYGSAAVAYGCRAWVNFNGTGTPAIRAQGNVSSVTDSAVGVYTVTFTNAFPNVNYSVLVTAKETDNGTVSGNGTNAMSYSYNTGSVIVLTANCLGAVVDPVLVNVAIFR